MPLGEAAHDHLLIAGLDEAGRGCLAGPVVAAAVILADNHVLPGLTDSKKLSPAQRTALAATIRIQAVAWSLGLAWPREIKTVNILRASLRAMARAVANLKIRPDRLIVDGNHCIESDLPQQAIVRADATIPAVSAASILAKTFRDKLLTSLDRRYPGYEFARHKGYPTARHLEALRRIGPSPSHRATFRGVKTENASSFRARRQCLPGI